MAVTTNARRKLRVAAAWAFAFTAAATATPPAAASDHGAPADGTHGAAAAQPFDPTLPRPMDLGSFNLRSFRPTHNEIANITFSLSVVFAAGVTDEEMAELETWKRRLRDQAITAARAVDPEALNDPKLVRVRRLMLLRVRRLPLPKPVEAVYLTDFAVSSG